MNQKQNENWLPVIGYEGLYLVSDFGRVRSLPRKDSRGVSWSGKILSPGATKSGHLIVSLCDSHTGRRESKYIHSLVLETFRGPAPEKFESLHDDASPSNNHLSNLKWGSRQENMADRARHGTLRRGEDVHGAKFCEEDILVIREAAKRMSQQSLARILGVAGSTISEIVNCKTWARI